MLCLCVSFVICKVIERIIRRQVFSFLDQKGCLNTTQLYARSFLSISSVGCGIRGSMAESGGINLCV